MGELTPRLLVHHERRWQWIKAIVATVALVAFLAVLACGKPTPSTDPTDPIPDPMGCGDGLAAVDLSGVCRATPQATMGALEAVL